MDQAPSPVEPSEKTHDSAGEEVTLEDSPREIHGIKVLQRS